MLGKLAGVAAGGLAALAVAPAAPGRISLLVAAGLPAAGFLVPDALLERRARLRSRRLLGALPDACDLLAVGAAAGRGTAAGLAEIAGAGGGPLADELRMTVAELACGGRCRRRCARSATVSRAARWRRSAPRSSARAVSARRSPISCAASPAALRRDQRRAVEERAARAAPKIQLVVALVLVPSVLLTIAAALIANADVLLSGF